MKYLSDEERRKRDNAFTLKAFATIATIGETIHHCKKDKQSTIVQEPEVKVEETKRPTSSNLPEPMKVLTKLFVWIWLIISVIIMFNANSGSAITTLIGGLLFSGVITFIAYIPTAFIYGIIHHWREKA